MTSPVPTMAQWPQVLVVDDDETVASVVVSYLERAGHSTQHLGDGRAALERGQGRTRRTSSCST